MSTGSQSGVAQNSSTGSSGSSAGKPGAPMGQPAPPSQMGQSAFPSQFAPTQSQSNPYGQFAPTQSPSNQPAPNMAAQQQFLQNYGMGTTPAIPTGATKQTDYISPQATQAAPAGPSPGGIGSLSMPAPAAPHPPPGRMGAPERFMGGQR